MNTIVYSVLGFVGVAVVVGIGQVIYWSAMFKVYRSHKPFRRNGGMDEVQKTVQMGTMGSEI